MDGWKDVWKEGEEEERGREGGRNLILQEVSKAWGRGLHCKTRHVLWNLSAQPSPR